MLRRKRLVAERHVSAARSRRSASGRGRDRVGLRPQIGDGRRRAIDGARIRRRSRSAAGGSIRTSCLISGRGSGSPRVAAPAAARRSGAGARSAEWKRSRNASRLAGDASCSLSPSTFSSSARASAAVANAVRGSSCSARPSQPRKAGRQRLEAAARRHRPRRRDDVADARRVLVVANQPAEDQRQRDDAHLRDVDTLIEARQTGRPRHRRPAARASSARA